MVPQPQKSFVPLLAGILLFLATFILFAPSIHYRLVDFDDPVFIIGNPIVSGGFSWQSIGRAFTALHGDRGMYTPLLWISYLLDTLFFRASPAAPWGFHLTNVLLHAVNAVLLFFILETGIRRPWIAFAAAAFWALHPLRVESVAWVTERKDTLSTFFAFASILCYLKAWEHGRPALDEGQAGAPPPPFTFHFSLFTFHCRQGLLCIALAAFAAGLLAKPMLVTLPFFLLLLDYWPLRRFSLRDAPRALPRLALRKWPWFLLSLVAAILTRVLHTGSVTPLSLAQRLCRLPSNYFFYLSKTFCPTGLLPLNPGHPSSPLLAVGALAILLAIAADALVLVRRCPGFAVGFFAFAGLLFPVSGIVPIGSYPVADRYSYLPAIGLSFALAALWEWFFAPAPSTHPSSPGQSATGHPAPSLPAFLSAFFVLAVLLALGTATRRILPVWKDPEAFRDRLRRFSVYHPFVVVRDARHAVASSGDFRTAALLVQGCIERYPRLFMLDPLAACIANIDGPRAAFDFLSANRPPPGEYLGLWAWRMAHLSLRLSHPDDALAYADLAEANLPPQSPIRGNIVHLRTAASSPKPADALPHALAQWMTYERADALDFFRRFIAANLDRPDILANIAWILATANWSPAPPSEALDYASRAIALAPDPPPPELLDTYAAALANASDFPAAAAAEERAISLLPPSSPSLPDYRARLDLYRRSLPYRKEIGIAW